MTEEPWERHLKNVQKVIDEHKPPADPFNGARVIIASQNVFDRLFDAMKSYPSAFRPDLRMSETLPDGSAYGYRLATSHDRNGEFVLPNEPVIVWLLSPKEEGAP